MIGYWYALQSKRNMKFDTTCILLENCKAGTVCLSVTQRDAKIGSVLLTCGWKLFYSLRINHPE